MDEDKPSLGEIARRVPFSWWVLLPAVLVHVTVLTFSRRVWTHMVESHNRSGSSSFTPDAHLRLAILAVGVLGTAAISFWQYGGTFGWNPGLRPPTVGDVVVARGLVKLLLLGLLYVSTYTLLRDYVFA